MLVPPDGRSASSRGSTWSGRFVQPAITCGAWLKDITKNSSSWLEQLEQETRDRARASAIRCPRMLSLTSSSRPSPMGTRSLAKCVIACGSPSSKTSKASRVSPETSLPFASATVAVMLTRSMPDLNRRAVASCVCAAVCASSMPASRMTEPRA